MDASTEQTLPVQSNSPRLWNKLSGFSWESWIFNSVIKEKFSSQNYLQAFLEQKFKERWKEATEFTWKANVNVTMLSCIKHEIWYWEFPPIHSEANSKRWKLLSLLTVAVKLKMQIIVIPFITHSAYKFHKVKSLIGEETTKSSSLILELTIIKDLELWLKFIGLK